MQDAKWLQMLSRAWPRSFALQVYPSYPLQRPPLLCSCTTVAAQCQNPAISLPWQASSTCAWPKPPVVSRAATATSWALSSRQSLPGRRRAPRSAGAAGRASPSRMPHRDAHDTPPAGAPLWAQVPALFATAAWNLEFTLSTSQSPILQAHSRPAAQHPASQHLAAQHLAAPLAPRPRRAHAETHRAPGTPLTQRAPRRRSTLGSRWAPSCIRSAGDSGLWQTRCNQGRLRCTARQSLGRDSPPAALCGRASAVPTTSCLIGACLWPPSERARSWVHRWALALLAALSMHRWVLALPAAPLKQRAPCAGCTSMSRRALPTRTRQ
jgi:hypothetical protein